MPLIKTMNEYEFNLWKLLEIIALRVRFVATIVLLATAISVVVAFLLPRWYQASTLLLPPKGATSGLGPASSLGDMISLTSGFEQPVMATPTDIYARILGSRTMAERVIDANDLQEYLKTNSVSRIFEILKKRATFKTTEEGLLEIFFIDRDPERAAQLANSYAEEFDKLNQELSISRARIIREFIEKRLGEVEHNLDSARRELKEFQRNHKAVDLDRQTQLAMESAVSLKVALAETEIDLNVKEQTLSSTHPEVISLKRRIKEIKSQISNLEFGGRDSSYLNLPVSEVPALQIQYADLTARVRVSETLFRMLSEQYEQAKIQEKMTTPTIYILDRAYPPEKPFRPNKSLIALATFAISLISALFLALFFHYLESLKRKSPDDFNRASFFFSTFLGWLPGAGRSAKKR
ncbi:MAG: hypothetical protein JSV44_08970 [Candidatus Zixiibacteriota bacterium]|nr:MAG: hypothetical protein JSV44_08970 [candidate division Zixibacteria bacterium]